MQVYTGDASERFSIWKAHERRCFWCTEPIAFVNLQIDHLIPKSASDQLARMIVDYSLPDDIEIDDFRNLVPSCSRCNRAKSNTLFDPSPVMIVQFANVAKRLPIVTRTLKGIRRGDIKAKIQVLIHEELKKGRLINEVWDELISSREANKTFEEAFDEEQPAAEIIDEERAVQAVLALLEVREFSKLLAEAPHAGNLGYMTEIAGESWCVRIFESRESRMATFGFYEVPPDGRARKIMLL